MRSTCLTYLTLGCFVVLMHRYVVSTVSDNDTLSDADTVSDTDTVCDTDTLL